MRALVSEMLGTFVYVAAVLMVGLTASWSGKGDLTQAMAAGLSYTAMCYALGGASGCHFNPAITLGLVAAGRFDTRSALPYVGAQVLGGLLAAGCVVALIGAGSGPGLSGVANSFGAEFAGTFAGVLAAEAVAAGLLLILFVGATSSGVPAGFAPIGMGLFLVVLHLVLDPLSNAALNPARATGAAVFAGETALLQLWVFWVAPIIGAVTGGLLGRWLNEDG